ncbi:MAG TPA: sulfite exporter TauE/SafE family protein [Thermoanaerobaculia bacterium]|nr:sulfite exporter TauE/SafE family protein [Thermoanaerobaculia bacterium]
MTGRAAALLLAFPVGLSLGLLGGGGSILTVPVLVYVAGFDAKLAIPASLVSVGTTSLVAALAHARRKGVAWGAAFAFGGAGLVGAFLGARVGRAFSGRTLLVLFSVLMVAAGLLMLRGRRGGERERAPRPLLVAPLGGGVGLLTGLLGVGGGFLIVPALVLAAGLRMPLAVGTSLVVIAINSAAGFTGHLGEQEVGFAYAAEFTCVCVLGALVGERLGRNVPAARLRRWFGAFVIAVGLALLAKNLAS